MKTTVLDASAMLAMFFGRTGHGKNARTFPRGIRGRPSGVHFGAVNWAEVLYKMERKQGKAGLRHRAPV